LSQAKGQSVDGSVLPPQRTTITCSPGAGRYAPVRRAATGVAAACSTPITHRRSVRSAQEGRQALPTNCAAVMSEVCRSDAIGVPIGALTLKADPIPTPSVSTKNPCASRRVVRVTVRRRHCGERLLGASVRIGRRKATSYSARYLRRPRSIPVGCRRLKWLHCGRLNWPHLRPM
jgi:hypothetical protein